LTQRLGLTELFRRVGPARRQITVLNYHHVDHDDFARQIALLADAGHRFVTLAEAIAFARTGRPRGQHRVCITFDDGVASFLQGPYPVLAARGIPATVFAIAGCMNQVPFWERLDTAFAATKAETFHWQGRDWDRRGGRAGPTRKAILHYLKRMTDTARRDDWVAELETALGVGAGESAGRRPMRRLMSWDEVRSLDPELVEIGGHTVSHPSLGEADAAVLDREIRGCRTIIEAELGRPVHTFAYPYGRWLDIGPHAVAAVRDAGFTGAVSSMTGLCVPGADPYRIARVGVTGREGEPALASRVTGIARFLKGE